MPVALDFAMNRCAIVFPDGGYGRAAGANVLLDFTRFPEDVDPLHPASGLPLQPCPVKTDYWLRENFTKTSHAAIHQA